MKRVLLTGATGFIGQHLIVTLLSDGYEVFALHRARSNHPVVNQHSKVHWLGCDLLELDVFSEWPDAIDIVIHLAGLAHKVGITQNDKYIIKKVNVDATRLLAKLADSSGVRQFIFLSTAKVYGEKNIASSNNSLIPYDINSVCLPADDYAKSKYLAEKELINVCASSTMSYTIFRPPLLFGEGVKANFYKLIQLVDKGAPLPLANVNNQKSFIYVGSLIDAILKSVDHELALNKSFPIKDTDISTAELIKVIAQTLEKPARLISVNSCLLSMLLKLIRREEQYKKLSSSFTIDDSAFREALFWSPPTTFIESIRRTISWYKTQES